jgi:hypothetical protein
MRIWQDIRYAVRSLHRTPTAAAAVVTFAISIGANTAVFSVVDAVLLRPLTFAEPSRLVADPRHFHHSAGHRWGRRVRGLA